MLTKIRNLILPILMVLSIPAFSQVTVDPPFPTINDTITVTFDATQGNGALAGITPVYAHAGLITSSSTTPTDWKYVQGNWGTADASVLMTDIGNDKHQLTYHIPTFYNVPTTETVLQLAFVFRTADGSVVGRAADGSDIYYDVYSSNSALLGAIFTPGQDYSTLDIGDNFQLNASSSVNATLTLYDNGTQIAQANGKNIAHNITVSGSGTHLVEFVADDGTNQVRDTVYYVVNAPVTYQDPPSGTIDGINELNDSTILLRLYAPNKEHVYVIGDFNDWTPNPNYYMNLSADSTTWWLEISGLTADQYYGFQYFVDGNIKVGDPYSELVLDGYNDQYIDNITFPNLPTYPSGKTSGIASLFKIGEPDFNWTDTAYSRPAKEKMTIYELLPRDFIAAHNYQTLKDTLDYLANMGINAIEFMPVNEFEGNESWGYNPSYHMALDKYYGDPASFKLFVDECHKRNIAVILDAVFNHAFSQNALCQLYWDPVNFRPSADNPWLNVTAKHDFNVGYDFNHESVLTQQYMDRILKYWIEEYHIDGFRFDLSKGFTQVNTLGNVGLWGQYDASRVALLKRMADEVWMTDPNSILILEHFAANNEEKELAEYGMMLWGNSNHNYNEATMGYISGSNFDWISYQKRGWAVPHVVGYMESHDEERLMFKNMEYGNSNGNYNIKDFSTAINRNKLAATFFFPIPGPKMIWQFGELGYDYSIDFNGRVGNKPIKWDYFVDADRKSLYDTYSALINLRNQHDVFHTNNYSVDFGGAVKRLHLDDANMNVTVLGNFGMQSNNATPDFQHTGWWYEFFTGDSINVTDVTAQIPLIQGEYRLYTDVKLPAPVITVSTHTLAESPNDLKVFPNPAVNQLNVAYEVVQNSDVHFQITNNLGQSIRTWTKSNVQGSQQEQISISDLRNGQYYLLLIVDGKATVAPFIVF